MDSVADLVVKSLRVACGSTGLKVLTPPGFNGASVYGPSVEAYVVGVSAGGYQVEVWKHTGNDPFEIQPFADLGDAARYAVAAAASGRQRRQSTR